MRGPVRWGVIHFGVRNCLDTGCRRKTAPSLSPTWLILKAWFAGLTLTPFHAASPGCLTGLFSQWSWEGQSLHLTQEEADASGWSESCSSCSFKDRSRSGAPSWASHCVFFLKLLGDYWNISIIWSTASCWVLRYTDTHKHIHLHTHTCMCTNAHVCQ